MDKNNKVLIPLLLLLLLFVGGFVLLKLEIVNFPSEGDVETEDGWNIETLYTIPEEQSQYNYLYFSDDGKSLSYVVYDEEEGSKVVQNGEVHSTFGNVYFDDYDMETGIERDMNVFSPDGSRFAYKAVIGLGEEDEKAAVVLDGEKDTEYLYVSSLLFSPDSQKFAYKGSSTLGSEFVVYDGVEGNEYPFVDKLQFSPDSADLIYRARDDAYQAVVINGEEEKQYDMVKFLTFSPDGDHFAYVASSLGESFVVLDGEELRSFSRIANLKFSDDGKYLVFNAEENREIFLVKKEI